MSFSANDNDSNLYGVDFYGKVWSLSSNNTSAISSLSWVPLPNPTKVSIKRLVSYCNILWGIASDHQINVYVPKRDICIRVREEIYENQRWNPVDGFTGKHLLPTDRAAFSSEDGTEPREKTDKLPSDAWQWECDWQIENTFENQLIPEGWTYALDFPSNYVPEKTFKSFVRRRKLFRYRKFVGTNRWHRIESLHKDHTQEPFIDVSVGGLNYMSCPETCCLWAVSILGKVYFRCNTSIVSPEGSHWQHISLPKGLEACQVTVARNGTPFVTTLVGSFMYRIGLTPNNAQGTDWLESSGPPGGVVQLSAGIRCLWGITRDKKCWTLKGNWPEIITQVEPKFEWIEIPGHMKSIVVGKSDDIIFALSDEEVSVLYLRVGISEDQKYGQSWKAVYEDVAWDSLSVCSSTSDMLDGPSLAASAESLVSLKPDIPQPQPMFYGEANKEGMMMASPNSFSWVDGACASCLRTGLDKDLEVGQWREDILNELQKLKMERSSFSYPDALEPSSVSWSKSARIKFLHVSRKSKWVDGQLEISDNNHLMFHENLEKTWLCSVSDVLSVFDGIAGSNTLTCRIRNGLEPGVAEFVNFKFSNDQDTEEWRTTISELSVKPLEDYSIADIWLTTREAEAHRAGLIRVLNVPVEAEVTFEAEESNLHHHPLVRGFLPESEVILEIKIPESAQGFAINLKGRGDTITAYHFNPRFTEAHVIRNSFQDGWGQEEKDGVFPFRVGQSYTVYIQCTQTHIITTVAQNKHKFIFHFKHRVAPKYICNMYVSGDVSVKSVRYNPKLGETYELEFSTQPVPGHFWKIEAGSNGSVWAIGYDLKVWSHTGTSKQSKAEGILLGPVTDEHIFYIYENQRWNPITGFDSHALPTDRHGWTDETGRLRMDKDEFRLPSGRWVWISDWEVDYDTPSGVDQDGWQYSVDFPNAYHPNKRLNDFVRRRRWKRVSRLTVIGPWQNASSGMKLVDISIRMNEDCEWEVLGLTLNGDAVVRTGITPEFPIGTGWESLATEKPLVSISGWYGQRIWAVGKEGFCYIRYGNTWQMLDRPRDTPLKMVKVGSSAVWSIGTNNTLYRRTEIQAVFPEGREWIRVCEGVTQISISPDGSLWALLKSDDLYRCVLAKRSGISFNNPGGLGWEKVAAGPWRQFSVAGCFSRNK